MKNKISALGKLILAATDWHLWIERNCRIFDHTAHPKFEVFPMLKRDVKILIKPSRWKSDKDLNEFHVLSD